MSENQGWFVEMPRKLTYWKMKYGTRPPRRRAQPNPFEQ
jgi:hypothetical protein